jgi:serine/threonine protein kinase
VQALILELIDGDTLAAAMTGKPLPLARALTLSIQIAEALDHAHRRGITHRDLKPSNIMLTRAGAKLLDFGLARWTGPATGSSMTGDQRSLTQTGAILGTIQYMAPEQLEGREADARSDPFALGAVIYEMVTGRRRSRARARRASPPRS